MSLQALDGLDNRLKGLPEREILTSPRGLKYELVDSPRKTMDVIYLTREVFSWCKRQNIGDDEFHYILLATKENWYFSPIPVVPFLQKNSFGIEITQEVIASLQKVAEEKKEPEEARLKPNWARIGLEFELIQKMSRARTREQFDLMRPQWKHLEESLSLTPATV